MMGKRPLKSTRKPRLSPRALLDDSDLGPPKVFRYPIAVHDQPGFSARTLITDPVRGRGFDTAAAELAFFATERVQGSLCSRVIGECASQISYKAVLGRVPINALA
jgi:hypothetical protein